MERAGNPSIDPLLRRQLAAANGAGLIGATFTLKGESESEPLPAARTRAIVAAMIDRVARQTACRPDGVNVFDNLQSFALNAPPQFVEKLLDAPEVESAMANVQDENMLIEPVSRGPVADGGRANFKRSKTPRRVK